MSLPKKVLLAIIILIFIVFSSAVTLFFFIPITLGFFFGQDTPPIDDKDLLLTKVEVNEQKNVYYDLVKFEKDLILGEEEVRVLTKHIEGQAWDEKFVKQTLSKNASLLTKFDEAIKKPSFQAPELSDPAKISIESVVVSLKPILLINTVKISSLKAISLSKKGKVKEAFDEAFKVIDLGQKIQSSQTNLIYYLIGLSIKTIGLETIHELLKTKIDNPTLNQYLKRLNNYEDNEAGLATAVKVEYLTQKSALESVAKEDNIQEVYNTEGFLTLVRNNFYFKPNKTKKLFADYTRDILRDMSKPCGFAKEKEPKRLTPSDEFKLIFTENALGKIVHDLVVIGLGSMHNRRCEGDLAVSGTKLLIAIRMYKNDKNSYPTKLNDLMPLYLTEIPKDPYNGESIRYSENKKLIYSVGKDLKDSGGSVGEDWNKSADPSFEIKF